MIRPKIKQIYQIYKRGNDPNIYIGKGPDKFVIEEPTLECEQFLIHLNGEKAIEELRLEYPKADEWLESLENMGVLEKDFGVDESKYERVSRQIYHFQLYDRPGFNPYEAQDKLRNAKVVVLGIGAGGTTLLRFLSSAGIGNLEAIDFDKIELSNLTTHTTIDEDDVGKFKTESIKGHLEKQNSSLNFKVHQRELHSKEDVVQLVDGADFFIQAFDYPQSVAATWTNYAGMKTGVPFGSIGVTDKGARVGPFVVPGKTACWECVGIPHIKVLKNHKAPLMGTMVAMLASIATHEIVKHISGFTESNLLGRSLYIDTETMEFLKNDHPINSNCDCQNQSDPVFHERPR